MKNDLNFFSIYHDGSKKAMSEIFKFAISIFVMLFLVLSVFGGLTAARMITLARITGVQSFLNSSDAVSAANLVAKDSAKLSELHKYEASAKNLSDSFKNQPFIDSKLLNDITSAMPSDTKAGAITVNQNAVILNCTAKSELSAAAFMTSLLKLGCFSSVYYGSVTQNAGNYTFTMTCSKAGVIK